MLSLESLARKVSLVLAGGPECRFREGSSYANWEEGWTVPGVYTSSMVYTNTGFPSQSLESW